MRVPLRPVGILSGFLGAGKTTILNHFLRRPPDGLRFAVIVNEAGAIGVDGWLLEESSCGDRIFQLPNGCLCCGVQGDFLRLAKKLAHRNDFDYLLVETSGAADPVAVTHPFLNQQGLGTAFQLDALITVVDALNWQILRKKEVLLDAQVQAGDFLVLSKTEGLKEDQLKRLRDDLVKVNPHAMVLTTEELSANPRLALCTRAFSLESHLNLDPGFLDELARRHGAPFGSVSLTCGTALHAEGLQTAIQWLAESCSIYRAKGVLAFHTTDSVGVLHGVNNRFHLAWGRKWRAEEVRRSDLVLIGRELDVSAIVAALRSAGTFEVWPNVHGAGQSQATRNPRSLN